MMSATIIAGNGTALDGIGKEFVSLVQKLSATLLNIGRPWFRTTATPFLSWVCILVSLAGVQSGAGEAVPHSNRYLLVVETSRTMHRRQAGVADTLRELLGSGMHGQMRPGDTLGVWTFDNELHTGRFPLQRWSPASGQELVAKVIEFLAGQTNDHLARLEKMLPAVAGVARDSEFISVVLVTSGDEKLAGTPFDDKINEIFTVWQKEQQRARMPMVTFLRGKRGVLTDFAVGPAPWPLELPPLPDELKPAIATAKKVGTTAAVSKPVKPATKVPPLIVTGKKAEPVIVQTPSADLSEPANPVMTVLQQTAEPTNQLVVAGSDLNGAKPKLDQAKTDIAPPAAPALVTPKTSAEPVENKDKDPLPASTASSESPVVPKDTPTAAAAAQTKGSETIGTAFEKSPSLGPGLAGKTSAEPARPGAVPVTLSHVSPSFAARPEVRLAGIGLALVAFGLLIVMMRRTRQPQKGSLITQSLERRSSV